MKKLILVFDRILNFSFLFLRIGMNCFYPFGLEEDSSLLIHFIFSKERKDRLS